MVEIDDGALKQAVARFVSLAGLPAPTAETLVEAALQAAVKQTLETIGGSGAVPSALTATRADELRYVCLQAGRVLSQREVGVLFRTTPANARSILTTMTATYEQALHEEFINEMRAAAEVTATGSAASGLRWAVKFSQQTAYDTARTELERLGLLNFAILDSSARTVDFDRSVITAEGNADILAMLGLRPPARRGR